MEETKLKEGDVLQINPDNEQFGGCFMIVSEPKSFGAQGYVTIPGEGVAYYRANFKSIEYVGKAVWYLK